jgi:hypothetical protein
LLKLLRTVEAGFTQGLEANTRLFKNRFEIFHAMLSKLVEDSLTDGQMAEMKGI